MPWVGFHTFRHTCATVLFSRGWNAVQVQRWLGHHKASFTIDTYVHLLDDELPEPEAIGAAARVPSVSHGQESTLAGSRASAAGAGTS